SCEVVSEVWLLRNMNLVLRHDLHGAIRGHHREVAQVMSMIAARILLEYLVQRVHCHLDRGVADGMDAELPTYFVALVDVREDLFGRVEGSAPESGLTFVVRKHPRGRSGESTVCRHFANRADTQTI